MNTAKVNVHFLNVIYNRLSTTQIMYNRSYF